MSDLFFDEIFDGIFGKPKVIYNCGGTKDMMPVCWTKTDNGYKSVCRTVGINADDISVKINNNNIIVSGETEYEGEKYNTNCIIPVSNSVINNIKSLKYKSTNGLTHIFLELKEDKISKIVPERIK